MFSVFTANKKQALHEAQQDFNSEIDNIEHDTNLNALGTHLSALVHQTSVSTKQSNINSLKMIIDSLNSLNKLGIEGEHTCYLCGLQLKLTYVNKKLVNLELIDYSS